MNDGEGSVLLEGLRALHILFLLTHLFQKCLLENIFCIHDTIVNNLTFLLLLANLVNSKNL